jgi:hypothetical protein
VLGVEAHEHRLVEALLAAGRLLSPDQALRRPAVERELEAKAPLSEAGSANATTAL